MIGIDISDRSVKLVRLRRKSGTHEFLNACLKEVPEGIFDDGIVKDEERMRAILQELFAACELPLRTRDPVVISVSEKHSFLRVVELPIIPEAEVGEAVQWEVAQHIPFGLENVYIDWQALAKGHQASSGHQEVLVGAAQRKVVDSLYKTLAGMKLDVAALELESQALVRALISPDLREKQGILLIDLGGGSTNVVIHDHGAIRFTATLERGSDRMRQTLTPKEIEMMNDSDKVLTEAEKQGIIGKVQGMYEELVVEVNGVVEFYNSNDLQHKVREIILTGGGSNWPGMPAAFLRVFENVHVQQGNPWVNLLSGQRSLNAPMNQFESVRFSTALGLALRPVIS